MAKIPDQNDIRDPSWTSTRNPENYDQRALAAPGHAAHQLGQSIASLGSSVGGFLDAAGAADEQNQKYETATSFINIKQAADDNLVEKQRNMSPDGSGFRSDVTKSTDDMFRDWFKSVPDKLKPQYDTELRKHAVSVEQRARNVENTQSDTFHTNDVIQKSGEQLDLTKQDPENLDKSIANIDTILENSKLPTNRRMDIQQKLHKAAEKAYIEGRTSQIEANKIAKDADGNSLYSGEQIEEQTKALMDEVKRRARPVGPQSNTDGTQGGAGGALPDVAIQPSPKPLNADVGYDRSEPIKGFVIHETQGADTLDGNVSWANKTNTGANYYIDKDGQVFQAAPDERAMNHAGKGRGVNGDARPDFGNGNTLAVELMTKPGERPNDQQIAAAHSLVASKAKQYGFTDKDVYGHGELAPGHKEATEGMDVVKRIRAQGFNAGTGAAPNIEVGVGKFVPPTTPGVITASADQETRSLNAEGYGDRLTGSIVVNGNTYQWVSGGRSGSRGSIPTGTYDIQRFTSGEERSSEGRSYRRDAFELNAAQDDLGKAAGQDKRDGLLIHDGRDVTAGCIGIVGKGKGTFDQFKKDLEAEQEKNGGKVAIQIGTKSQLADAGKAKPAGDKAQDGVTATATAYSPKSGGDKMEGGYESSKPGPDGKAEVRTLADYASGKSQYVTLAGDPSQYGKTYTIPSITFTDAAGKTQTLQNVKGVVHDTGSAFKGAGSNRFDIPADKDLPDGGASQPYSKQQISFIPNDGSKATTQAAAAPTPMAKRGLTQYAGLGNPPTATDATYGDTPAQGQGSAGGKAPNAADLEPQETDGTPEGNAKEAARLAAAKASQLGLAGVATHKGEPVAGIKPDGTVTTILDGVPDDQPLSALPQGVREQVMAMLPKDALKQFTMPDGSKTSAVDQVTVGQIKNAFAAPVEQAKRDGSVQLAADTSTVADSQGLYVDNPKIKYLSDKERDVEYRKLQISMRNLYKGYLPGEEKFILENGIEAKDAKGQTFLERAAQVMMPNQLQEFRRRIDQAKYMHDTITPIPDMSENELQNYSQKFSPLPSDSADVRSQKALVGKKAITIITHLDEQRRKDGAASVDPSVAEQQKIGMNTMAPEVKDAYRKIRESQPQSYTTSTGPDSKPVMAPSAETASDMTPLQARELLVGARIAAQERIFGDKQDYRIKSITKAEARNLMGFDSSSGMPEEELAARLKAATARADQMYGQYASRAWHDAVMMIVHGEKGADMARGEMEVYQKSIRGQTLTGGDRQRASLLQSTNPASAFLNPQSAAPPQVQMPKQTNQGPRFNGTTGPANVAPTNGQPAMGFQSMTPANDQSFKQPLADKFASPTQADDAWLAQDPGKRAAIYDQSFGADASKQALYRLQNKPNPVSPYAPHNLLRSLFGAQPN